MSIDSPIQYESERPLVDDSLFEITAVKRVALEIASVSERKPSALGPQLFQSCSNNCNVLETSAQHLAIFAMSPHRTNESE